MFPVNRIAPAPWLVVKPASAPPVARPSWLARARSSRPVAAEHGAPPLPDLRGAPPERPSQPPIQEFPPPLVSFPPEPEPQPEAQAEPEPEYPDLREENATLRARLAECNDAMTRMRRDLLERSEAELVQLSMAIAEKIVRRELATAPDLVARWAREAVDLLAPREEVVVAVGPTLAAETPPEAWPGALPVPHRVEVEPSLGPRGCEVRAGPSSVDVSVEGRLAALRGALDGDDP